MEAAVRYVVAMQEHAGARRHHRRRMVAQVLHRRHRRTGARIRARHYPDGPRPWTVVVDKLAPKQPGFIAREVTFLKTHHHNAQDQGHAAVARAARRAHVGPQKVRQGLSEARRLRARLRADPAARAGTRARGRRRHRADRRSRTCACSSIPRCAASYDDPDAAADFAVDMVNEVVEGISGVKLAVHLCRRAGARARGEARFQGGYDPIIKQLNRLKVHHLTMEFTAPAAGDMAVFREAARGLRDRPRLRRVSRRADRHRRDDRRARAQGPGVPRAGAHHAQPRLRLRARLGRRRQHRRSVPQALQRSGGRTDPAGAIRLRLGRRTCCGGCMPQPRPGHSIVARVNLACRQT